MKFLYTIVAFSLLTLGVSAADFAVVDYQSVIQKSKAFSSFQSQAESNRQTLEAQFKKESESLKTAEQNLINKRPDYSEIEFNKKRAEFESKVEAFKTKFQAKQTEFEQNNAEALKTIEDQAKKAISDVSKDKKYEVVYQAAALLYFDASKDVSSEILKKLDTKLPKVSLKKVS